MSESGGFDAATQRAPAKLTVSLHITGRRSDGYHLLDAEMVSLDLADHLTFVEPPPPDAPEGLLDVIAPERADGPPFVVPAGADNLVSRAMRAVGRRAHVQLVKHIPPGAGLGGGSSDAAAVLRWAGCSDVQVAAALGADVPFCLRGGRARVTGIGDGLEPLPYEARTYTLLTPPFGCSTPAVYRAWDELGGPSGDGHNDLQAAALAVEPRLAHWRDMLGEASGQEPVLAGSGSTWFVEGAFPGADRVVATTVRPSDPVTTT